MNWLLINTARGLPAGVQGVSLDKLAGATCRAPPVLITHLPLNKYEEPGMRLSARNDEAPVISPPVVLISTHFKLSVALVLTTVDPAITVAVKDPDYFATCMVLASAFFLSPASLPLPPSSESQSISASTLYPFATLLVLLRGSFVILCSPSSPVRPLLRLRSHPPGTHHARRLRRLLLLLPYPPVSNLLLWPFQ